MSSPAVITPEVQCLMDCLKQNTEDIKNGTLKNKIGYSTCFEYCNNKNNKEGFKNIEQHYSCLYQWLIFVAGAFIFYKLFIEGK